MATTGRFNRSPLDILKDKPQIFNFFQAIRLLDIFLSKNLDVSFENNLRKHTPALLNHFIQFQYKTSLSFPYSEITKFKVLENNHIFKNKKFILEVTNIGLTGVSGPLPYHYTETILERVRLKDTVLKDFLSIFEQRFINFLYQAWSKNQIFISFEKNIYQPYNKDVYAQALQSLHGNFFSSSKFNAPILSKVGTFYSGLLSQRPKSISGLKQILSLNFNLSIQILSFQGTYLYLEKEFLSKIDKQKTNNQLGKTALLGTKTWSVDNKILIKIGPLNYKIFQRFLLDNSFLDSLKKIIDHYLPHHIDYNFQLILKADYLPFCQLKINSTSQLGLNTWLITKSSIKNRQDTYLKGRSISF